MDSETADNSLARRSQTGLVSPSGLSAAEILGWIVEVTNRDQPRCLERLRLDDLRGDWSPRTAGLNRAHVRRLSETELPLPPIYVHRDTLQIIDGHHRVAAAAARGLPTISAYLIEGSADLIFVIAVSANMRHGLPLSLSDRKEAAVRLLDHYPGWSNRAVADITGLSGATVEQLRRATAHDPQLNKRLGRDGRQRPLSTAAGRRAAAELMATRPDASLRQIATIVGISPGTVRDVRRRLSRGEEPVPDGSRHASRSLTSGSNIDEASTGRQAKAEPPPADASALVVALSKDPALRMNDNGRELLRWLYFHAVDPGDVANLVEHAPEHTLERLIDFAHRCSLNWAAVAERIRRQMDSR